MNRRQLTIICLGICFSIIMGAAFLTFRVRCIKYSCADLSVLYNAKEIAVFENTKTAYRAMLSSVEGQVRFSKYSGLNQTDAETLTRVTLMNVRGLFDNALSPYPGPLSSKITCDDKYKPVPLIQQNGSLTITTFYGYLNNRLQYGTCIDNQVTHYAYNAIFFCEKESAWYRVELIVPLEKTKGEIYYRGLLASASCKDQPQFIFGLPGLFPR